jgi:hypothetical protein
MKINRGDNTPLFLCYNSKMKFYVYYYINEQGIPYYVGKGKGSRWKKKHSCVVPPAARVVFYRNLSEDFALEFEERLIRLFGLKKDGGLLENKMRKGVKNCPQDPVRVSQDPVALPPINQLGNSPCLEPDHAPRSTKRLAKTGPKVAKTTEVLGMEFPSVSAAARFFGVDRKTLRNFIQGHTSCPMKCKAARAVQCGEHCYSSLREAARAFQMDKAAVKWRIESPHWKDWEWV